MRSMRTLVLDRRERTVGLMRSMRMKFSTEGRGWIFRFNLIDFLSNLFDKSNKKSIKDRRSHAFFFFMHEDFNSQAKREDFSFAAQQQDFNSRLFLFPAGGIL